MTSPALLTVGHSTHAAGRFGTLLRSAGIERIIDVRRYPGSRRSFQFRRDQLERWLPDHGVSYTFAGRDLGGHREPAPRSPHLAIADPGLRAYADHMAGPAFRGALDEVLAIADVERVAVMCAEADWRACHRRMIADVVVLLHARPVLHLVRDGSLVAHEPDPAARVAGDRIVYDLGDRQLPLG